MSHTYLELVALAQSQDKGLRAIPWPEVLKEARLFAQQERQRLRARHDAGESGAGIVHALSDSADVMVRGALDLCVYHTPGRRSPLRNVALCALGGYGRRELNPNSDLDVCLLYPRRMDAQIEALNQRLVPFLWDLGFRVGYTLHSVGQALELARKDPQVYTTYAQARLLCGTESILRKLKTGLGALRPREMKALLDSVAEREFPNRLPERHRDLYHSEPDIKESVGGLRDYHAARWMILLRHGAPDFDEIERLGLISNDEHLECLEGVDFLLRIRNEIHFSIGKSENLLSFALQRHLCESFGYGPATPSTMERFMQDYYVAARRTRRFLQVAARVCDVQTDAGVPDMPLPGRGGIAVHMGQIRAGAGDPQWFAENPVRLMEIFWESARRRMPLSRGTGVRVTENLPLVNETFRSSELVRRFFMGICSRPLNAGFALREAAATGLLGAYLPEFQAVHGIVRYADFHSYPVDEHTLRAVEALAEIPKLGGTVGPFLERTLEHVRSPHLLVLAIVCHDLGKAGGEEHVEEGVRLVRQIGARMGLSTEDTEHVAFLVQNHMLMTHNSIYRDTDDQDTVNSFAETMKTEERLRELLLLSYADLSAVGPGVWNEWKGALLVKLFLKSERCLLGRGRTEDAPEFWRLPKAREARAFVPAALQDQVESHIVGLGERYFHGFSPDHIGWHLMCLESARETGMAIACRTHTETDMSEVVICTRDKHGLFAELAGSFASQLIDVHSAAIFTTADEYAMDCFTVRDAANRRPLTETQIAGLQKVLFAVLMEGSDVQRYVEQSRKRIFALMQPRAAAQTSIEFDNASSRTDTVIDIETGDRTGLLYDIARALARQGVDLTSARIVTDVRRVRDSFYVRRNQAKLEELHDQEVVREALLEAILPPMLAGIQGESS